ncbi:MAG: transposase [Patescibacteria group bacterium]|nr:transposase [Patescibacteria group bacterium]
MPRIIAEDIDVYHAVTRGNNRMPVFSDTDDHLAYLAIIQKYKTLLRFRVYNYILMPNHVHLLLDVCGKNLSNIMMRINLSYSLRHKRKYDRTGHLWEKRFWSDVIQDEKYFLTCAAYIELNCVRADIVAHPADYRWSSYNKLAFGTKDVIVDYSDIYLELGSIPENRMVAYRAMIKLFERCPPSNLTGARPQT